MATQKIMVNKGEIMKNNQQYIEDCTSNDELGYFQKVIPTTILTVPIDEPIRESRYYRQVVSGISELVEGDELHFKISSPGGLLTGLETMLSAVKQSPATSIAFIDGECHSAASILALNCDAVAVSEYATMLCHFVSFGVAGPSNHIQKHSEHVRKTSEKLFRNTYKYFLTEEEITKCVEDDFQLWLDADQIMERFENRVKMLEAEQPCNCCDCNSEDSYEEPCEDCDEEDCEGCKYLEDEYDDRLPPCNCPECLEYNQQGLTS